MRRLICLLLLPLAVPFTQARTWTDVQGRTMEAEAVSIGDGMVTFSKSDGQTYAFPLASLCEADQTYLSEQEAAGKLALWEAIYKQVRKDRPDLAAYALDAQGKLLESEGRTEDALGKYETIIADYAEAGPLIIDALRKAEDIFRERNQYQRAIRLYERTWRSIRTPEGVAGELLRSSNWYRVGTRFEKLLREGRRDREAGQVRQRLDQIMNG